MTEEKTITMMVVKEDDTDITRMEIGSDDESIDDMVKFVSPQFGEINTISMNELALGTNVLLILDAHAATSTAGYNMTMHMFPVFGTMLFAEFGMGNDGTTQIVGLSEENQKVLEEFIPMTKKYEIDNGGRQAIIDRVNEIGKEQYLQDLDNRYREMAAKEETAAEAQYKENQNKSSEE